MSLYFDYNTSLLFNYICVYGEFFRHILRLFWGDFKSILEILDILTSKLVNNHVSYSGKLVQVIK